MKFGQAITTLVIGCLLVACVIFFFKLRSTSYDYSELQTLLGDTINHYEIVVTDQGTKIATQVQKAASLENAIAAGLVRESELKERNIRQLDHIVRLENEIAMYEINIDLPDSNVVVVTDTNAPVPEGTYLRVPADFFYSDEWTLLAGTITGPGIAIRELRIKTEPSIFIGYQKAGFFKPLIPVVTVEDANPYVSIVAMQNVTIRKKPPFYKRPWWHRFEGMAIIIGTQMIYNKVSQ